VKYLEPPLEYFDWWKSNDDSMSYPDKKRKKIQRKKPRLFQVYRPGKNVNDFTKAGHYMNPFGGD